MPLIVHIASEPVHGLSGVRPSGANAEFRMSAVLFVVMLLFVVILVWSMKDYCRLNPEVKIGHGQEL